MKTCLWLIPITDQPVNRNFYSISQELSDEGTEDPDKDIDVCCRDWFDCFSLFCQGIPKPVNPVKYRAYVCILKLPKRVIKSINAQLITLFRKNLLSIDKITITTFRLSFKFLNSIFWVMANQLRTATWLSPVPSRSSGEPSEKQAVSANWDAALGIGLVMETWAAAGLF